MAESFEEFLNKRMRLSEMADSIGTVIDVVVQATEGLITDQELCNKLEQLTKGRIEREKNMPALTELEDIKNVCDRFFRRDRSVSWIDVGVVILQLEEKYQSTLVRIISHALRSSDHTNI